MPVNCLSIFRAGRYSAHTLPVTQLTMYKLQLGYSSLELMNLLSSAFNEGSQVFAEVTVERVG